MNWRSRTIKFITVLIVILFILNPETTKLAIFIDAVGLEMMLLLFEVQLLTIAVFAYDQTVSRLLRFWLAIYCIHSCKQVLQ